MASAAQRAWARRGREQAASTPPSTTRIPSSGGSSSYRGPTEAQIKAGTLAATPATTEHRKSARTTALTQSGIRAGQTPAQAVAEATTTVYGAKSEQAKHTQAILDKQKADITRGVITRIQDLPKSPHDIPLTSAQIHRRERLFEDSKRETLFEALKGKSGEITKYQVIPTEKKARRAYLDLQSSESKLQTNEAQLYLAERKLVKWDKHIKDGAFVGSESQYNKYVQDFNSYSKVSNRYDKTYTTYATAFDKADTTGKQLEQYQSDAHRAKFGGLMGKYEDAETKAAEQIAAAKVEFKDRYPLTAQRIDDVAAFIKEASELQVVGPAPSGFGTVTKAADPMVTGLQLDEQSLDAVMQLQQREFVSGMIQQAGKKPVKTAVMVGAGLVTGPTIKGVSTVAKTLGAGRKAAIAGKGVLYGMGGLYVVGTGVKYMDAGTPREKGAVLGEAVFQELMPLMVGGYIGTKLVTGVPKVASYTARKTGPISKHFVDGSKRMFADNKAMMSMGKPRKQRLLELVAKEEKRLGRPLLESEYKALEALVGRKTVKTGADIWKKIEAENKRKLDSGEYKEVKIGSGAQQQIQLVKVKQKILTEQSLKEVVKLKEEFKLVIKPIVKTKVTQKKVQKVKVVTDAQKAEALRLKQQSAQRQAAYQSEMQALADQMPALKRKVVVKTVQKQVLKDKSITKQILELKQQYRQKLITKQVYEQKLAQLTKQALKLAQSQKQTLKQAQKTVSSLSVAVVSLSTITEMQKQFQSIVPLSKVKPKLEAKQKVKALAKPKTRARVALTPKQKAAKAAATRKAVERAKKARVVKVKAKPKEFVKPIFPPLFPAMQIPTEKKLTKKRMAVITLNQKNLNAVATFRQVLGGL